LNFPFSFLKRHFTTYRKLATVAGINKRKKKSKIK
jgi:hypothetical protein